MIVTESDARPHPSSYFALVVYALLVAMTAHRHEPWVDEAQSWLLARDASLVQLWSHLLHYEGTPGLWQTLLHSLIRLGLPYSAYNFVPAILALAAAVLLLRYAPLPLFVRILLPFTYYLCYQYAVIARSYALIAPLLFAIAVVYPQATRRPVVLTVLLCLLAGVSVHGFILSVCVWLTLYLPKWRTHSCVRPALAYSFVLILFVISAWPAKDVAFAQHRGFANLPLFQGVAQASIAGAFTGNWIASLAVIALSWAFLWRGGGWLFFLIASLALCLLGALVYAQPWHFGIIFLAWVFAIWISAYRTTITLPALLALLIATVCQCSWTASAIRYDWSHPYSGSSAAAEYLRSRGHPIGGLYAIGYPSTALQPYFAGNLYSNFNNPANGAYWDWSERNTADNPTALFGSDRRELVLVGYKALAEKQHCADLLTLLGYRMTHHFDGNTFWQTAIFEPESFDLYTATSEPSATSTVNMSDPGQTAQLLSGFYDIEGGKSRWTARNFSVLLKAPPGSKRNGAELELSLYVPEVQIKNLGAMTLSADVGGHELPAHTFSQPNLYTYSTRVPAEALRTAFVAVDFRLDKAAVNLNGDSRELGVIVTAVSLQPAPPAP